MFPYILCAVFSPYRSDTIEPILSLSLFPTDFPVKDKVKKWVCIFSGFDKVEVKALEKILEQKQRYVKLLHLILPLLFYGLRGGGATSTLYLLKPDY